MEVYDTETGAKLFDDLYIHEINKMEPEEIEAYKAGKPAIFESIKEEIGELAEDMVRQMCEAMTSCPWTGYVASAVDNRVFISSGSSVGLKMVDVLDVHDRGEVIEKFAGKKVLYAKRQDRRDKNHPTG